MPESSNPHSLLVYRRILEAQEEAYRSADTEARSEVIREISKQIRDAASVAGAGLPDKESLKKVCGGLAFHFS